MENDTPELMDHTFLRLPLKSIIGCPTVLTNFELVNDICLVLHHPRNARVTNSHCRFEFGLKLVVPLSQRYRWIETHFLDSTPQRSLLNRSLFPSVCRRR